MRRRSGVAVALFAALALALAADVAITALVLDDGCVGWRPVPPFGAVTHPRQLHWLERQRAELAGERPTLGFGAFDAELGWTNRPGSYGERTRIDESGARASRPEGVVPPPDALRLACFGDSFTFCDEVADDETWPWLLERRWPAAACRNLGVGGYGTDQALLRFRRTAPELRAEGADAVLIGFLVENAGRNVNRYRPTYWPTTPSCVGKPRFVLAEGGGLELAPLPFEDRRALLDAVESGAVLDLLAPHEGWPRRYVPAALEWSSLARLAGAWRAYRDRRLDRVYADPEGEPTRVTLALLETFHREALALGAREAPVLLFGGEPEVRAVLDGGRPPWAGLAAALEARGVPTIDLVGAVADAARAEGEAGLFMPGRHLAREGNEVVARTVEAWLRPRLEAAR